tara:strand:- start:179 stop:652 length:474 start_codon:yes stop_codon:yes gene_type:complete
MKFISHRGNLQGRHKINENIPSVIENVISNGYNVEIDVWESDDKLYLGHDEPQWNVSLEFFKSNYDKLLIHCKDDASLFRLSSLPILDLFSHADDKFTLSSKGKILIHPHTITTYRKGILIMPEMSHYTVEEILQFDGIVSDNIKFYEDCYNTIRKQ